jgi:hypothetical protein
MASRVFAGSAQQHREAERQPAEHCAASRCEPAVRPLTSGSDGRGRAVRTNPGATRTHAHRSERGLSMRLSPDENGQMAGACFNVATREAVASAVSGRSPRAPGLPGATGPAGPKGDTGDKGAKGDLAGRLFERWLCTPGWGLCAGTPKEITASSDAAAPYFLTMNVPAGSYVVTAEVVIVANSPGDPSDWRVQCTARTVGTAPGTGWAGAAATVGDLDGDVNETTLSIPFGMTTAASIDVGIRCFRAAGSGATGVGPNPKVVYAEVAAAEVRSHRGASSPSQPKRSRALMLLGPSGRGAVCRPGCPPRPLLLSLPCLAAFGRADERIRNRSTFSRTGWAGLCSRASWCTRLMTGCPGRPCAQKATLSSSVSPQTRDGSRCTY